MAAFDSNAFSTSAFSVNAFDFGGVAPVVPTAPQQPTGGGYIRHHPDYFRKSRKRIREERERLGIAPEVLDLIERVAKRQATALESDSQKRLEELNRELQLAEVEWQGRYLEVLNDLRERYIAEEISRLLAKKLRDEEDDMILAALAALI